MLPHLGQTLAFGPVDPAVWIVNMFPQFPFGHRKVVLVTLLNPAVDAAFGAAGSVVLSRTTWAGGWPPPPDGVVEVGSPRLQTGHFDGAGGLPVQT